MRSCLFSRFVIGKLTLRNRIVMAAMGNNFSNENGRVSDRGITYYLERAKGGAGLIITEACPVSPEGRHRRRSICAYDDSFLPGLRRLVDAVHAEGSAIALQLHHAGRLASQEIIEDRPLAPSSIPVKPGSPIPKEINQEEIHKVIQQFAEAALRAQRAGFDAVEIHGGHGYLIHQFLSPRTNRRKDSYGENVTGRLRFALETIYQVRERVGDSLPVFFRLSAEEFVEGGYRLEEALTWVRDLKAAGISAIHVSGGTTESAIGLAHVVPPMAFADGFHLSLASAVKKMIGIPVTAVGRLNNLELAEEALGKGHADLIAVGRAFLCDPHWPAKAERGEEDRIRPCLACNHCIGSLSQQQDLTCSQNAALGKEAEFRIQPVNQPRKVFVVGGGPAGMEAALQAGRMHHDVTLFEDSSQLGGQILLASVPPHKQVLEKAVKWLSKEIEREGVKIRLNTKVDATYINEQGPHAVILATGAHPVSPVPVSSHKILSAWEVLAGRATGKKVLVLGGGMVGVETAEMLFQRGCEVKVLEMRDELALDMEGTSRALLLRRIDSTTISFLTKTRVEEVHEGRVLMDREGKKEWLEGDTIVFAMGSAPNDKLLAELEGKVPQLFSIGDCVAPRRIKEAIHEGFWAGLHL